MLMVQVMSRQPSHGVVLPALHHGNRDVTTPRDLQITGRRRYCMDNANEPVTSRALALHVGAQDIINSLCTFTSRPQGVTCLSDSGAKRQLQEHLCVITDVIHKLSHDVQV